MIEKCLEYNTKEVNKQMVAAIMGDPTQYYGLLSDQFGNYVLQKSLSVAQEPQLSQFLKSLAPEVLKLQHHSDFGHKIYQRLVKKYPVLDPGYQENLECPRGGKIIGPRGGRGANQGPGGKRPGQPKNAGYGRGQDQARRNNNNQRSAG